MAKDGAQEEEDMLAPCCRYTTCESHHRIQPAPGDDHLHGNKRKTELGTVRNGTVPELSCVVHAVYISSSQELRWISTVERQSPVGIARGDGYEHVSLVKLVSTFLYEEMSLRCRDILALLRDSD